MWFGKFSRRVHSLIIILIQHTYTTHYSRWTNAQPLALITLPFIITLEPKRKYDKIVRDSAIDIISLIHISVLERTSSWWSCFGSIKMRKSVLHAIAMAMALQRIQCNENFLLIIWRPIFFLEIFYLFNATIWELSKYMHEAWSYSINRI